jgi:hypothetical protein
MSNVPELTPEDCDAIRKSSAMHIDIAMRTAFRLGVERAKRAPGLAELLEDIGTQIRENHNWLREVRKLEEENSRLRKALEQYRWRPISEIHEDLGPCVFMCLDDPGYMEIGSNLDEDFEEAGWTHFAEVPKLTHEEAEALKIV